MNLMPGIDSRNGIGCPEILPTILGNKVFKETYGLKYSYVAGSMYRGISSKNMVVKMAKAGMLGFFGAGGLKLGELENVITSIQQALPNGYGYGFNLLYDPANEQHEENTVALYLKYQVPVIEASAYMVITAPLVWYRAQGLGRNPDGSIRFNNRIIAKLSRPEVAEAFLSPAPPQIVAKLLREGKIVEEQAKLLELVPMADDLCIEADSGGHTDGGVAYALMPAMFRLRDDLKKRYQYINQVRIGAAGGIGTPEAAAASFIMGADFILTGSINQCTVEAGISDAAKNMLQHMNIQDTEYAPAGDMFEFGAKVQVLKKGVFFPARAKKLYELYIQHNSLDDIDKTIRKQIEERYLQRGLDQAFEDIKQHYKFAENKYESCTPKQKMALVFKWYFRQATLFAINGTPGREVDYQIQCGPALGAFNQWVKGTFRENWQNRHVDDIALFLMDSTAQLLNRRYQQFWEAASTASIQQPIIMKTLSEI